MSTLIPVNPVPLPVGDPLTAPREPFKGDTLAEVVRFLKSQASHGFLQQTWQRFLSQLQQTISSTPTRIDAVEKVGQIASIGATDISGGKVAGGFYRYTYYFRVTTPASVSSSLSVTFDWVDKGVVTTKTFTAETGNTITTNSSDSYMLRCDGNSPLRYSTNYASVGTAMVYDVAFVLERVQA